MAGVPWVDLRDLGAPDGNGDATNAWKAALAIAQPHMVMIPAYTYTIQEPGVVSTDRVHVRGMGKYTSVLNFVPAANDQACLHFSKSGGNDALVQCSAADFSIISTDTSRRKFAIRADACSELSIEHISVLGVTPTATIPFTGGAAISPFTAPSSSGLYLRGWEFGRFRDLSIKADIPIRIGPNTDPDNPNIGIDHSHFTDMYLLPTGDNPSYYLESGLHLTSVVLDGTQACVGGKYGLYWKDTTGSGSSHHLTIRGMRCEQFVTTPPGQEGYQIYIEKSAAGPLRGLRIEDSYGGAAAVHRGIFLRNVKKVNLIGWDYFGTIEALNLDASVTHVDARNCELQANSTVSLGTLVEVDGRGLDSSLAPKPKFFHLDAPDQNFAAGKVYRFMGQYMLAKTDSLAHNGQHSLPTFLGGYSMARISIAYKGATKHGGFEVMYDPSNAYLVAGGPDTGVGNMPGKITVLGGSPPALFNQLGETVTFKYMVSLL